MYPVIVLSALMCLTKAMHVVETHSLICYSILSMKYLFNVNKVSTVVIYSMHVLSYSTDTHSLTYLEVRVYSQGFVYQTMTTRVPGLQMHDVTLCFLVS